MRLIRSLSAIYLGWCLISMGLWQLGSLLIPQDDSIPGIIPLSTAVSVFLALAVFRFYMRHTEPLLRDRHRLRGGVLIFILLVLFAGYGIRMGGVQSMVLSCFFTANLIVLSTILGVWMTSILKRSAEMIPLCLVAAMADLFSVVSGPTKEFASAISDFYHGDMQGLPPLVDFFLVKTPVPGLDDLMPVFGISDWVIIVFLSAASLKLEMNDNILGKGVTRVSRTVPLLYFPVGCLGLAAAMAASWLTNGFIPALPFVVLFFLGKMVVKYPEMRQLRKSEMLPTAAFCLLFFVLIVSAYFQR